MVKSVPLSLPVHRLQQIPPFFGRLFGGDYEYGARLVVLTTLLSLFTIPIIVQFAQVLSITSRKELMLLKGIVNFRRRDFESHVSCSKD